MAFFAAGIGYELGLDTAASDIAKCMGITSDGPDYSWLTQLGFVAALTLATYTEVWGILTFGPTPPALFGGLVVGLFVWVATGVLACVLESSTSVFTCMVTGAVAQTVGLANNLVSSVTGIPLVKWRNEAKGYWDKLFATCDKPGSAGGITGGQEFSIFWNGLHL